MIDQAFWSYLALATKLLKEADQNDNRELLIRWLQVLSVECEREADKLKGEANK